jgi:GTP cyclohydrolase I
MPPGPMVLVSVGMRVRGRPLDVLDDFVLPTAPAVRHLWHRRCAAETPYLDSTHWPAQVWALERPLTDSDYQASPASFENDASFESAPPFANHHTPAPRTMPDIAKASSARAGGRLDRVGMGDIEVPVLVLDSSGRVRMTPSRVDAFVSLEPSDAKGIHMSRLFLGLQSILEDKIFGFDTVEQILDGFLRSHEGLSTEAELRVRFDWMRKQRALVSDNAGWRTYPVELFGRRTAKGLTLGAHVRITYSSTCPCSAALARQLIQEAFDRDFAGEKTALSFDAVRTWLGTPEAIRATPHSQRSHADVTVHFASADAALDLDTLIDLVEGALKTVVQAAVKREDEQAFALLNGENLMFCEDAARIVKRALDHEPRITDYRIKASHFESLHPHDAVAITTRGVAGGLRP